MIVRKGNGSTIEAPEAIFDRLFNPEEFFTGTPAMRRTVTPLIDAMLRPATLTEYGYGVPALDLYRKDGAYVIECALPGLKREDVTIEIDSNVITIAGKYSSEEKDESKRYHFRELRRGSFNRSISFPENIDPDKVTANFDKGMLSIVVQALAAPKTKRVEIKG